ncbi:MAG TPA: branched-chain amino acid ABC transporter permease [Actinomycetota bacterium]|nr:branched-chain amino acid ABC transporter permease [Actinomycetota bacterium]
MATATETLPAAQTHERWHPTVTGWLARIVVLLVLLGGLLLVTAIVPQFWADRISLAVIYAIIGLSLNIVLGYVGQVSLGHHGFVGIAAFVAAYYATEKAGCAPEVGCDVTTFFVSLLFAAASGAIAAGILGLVALRIKGLYLALITLAYGFMAETSIFEISALTRGGAGMPAARPDGFTSDRAFAFLCFAFLAVVVYVDWRLIKSKVGRAILSLKHSEPVASSYGINVTAYKVYAFTLSGLFAGLGGGLFAFRATNVVSNDFNFATALLWVLMVVIGGLGNRTGVIIGSAFFALFPFLFELIKPLEHYVRDTLGREPGFFAIVLGALLAILTIVQYPGGIAQQLSPITRWLRGERFSMHPEGHGRHRRAGHGLKARLRSRHTPGAAAEAESGSEDHDEPEGLAPAESPELAAETERMAAAITTTTESAEDASEGTDASEGKPAPARKRTRSRKASS